MLRSSRRTRRAFTLVELVVSVSLGLVLVSLALALVSALVSAHATNVATNAVQRDLGYVSTQLKSDFDNSRVCDPSGLGTPLRDIAENEMQLWADVNGDGKPDVVWWRWSAGSLQRTVIVGDGSCTFPVTGAQWRTLADNVSDPATDPVPGPLFSGRYHGATKPGYPTGGCSGAGADNCLFDAVEVSFSKRSSAGGPSFPSTEIFQLDLSGSRLVR